MIERTLRLHTTQLDRKLRADVLLVPVRVANGRVDATPLQPVAALLGDRLSELVSRYHGVSEVGAIDDHLLASRSALRRVALVSVGSAKRPTRDDVRAAAGTAAQWCGRQRIRHAALAVDPLVHAAPDDGVGAWVEGSILAGFRYTARKSSPSKNHRLDRLTLASARGAAHWLRDSAEQAVRIAESVNLARYLGHEPPNILHPVSLARRVASMARAAGLRCRLIDDRRMRALRMGALLAVGNGSAYKPRLIVLEHRGRRPTSRPVVLVGKAITHDSGGYSIKPAASMPDMKYDKCGGMAVFAALVAAAQLKLPRRVVGIIAAAENMISAQACRAGDIVTSMSGKTIEIVSTDAEGRLILADALTFAQREFSPAVIIDLATLTGACNVALGAQAAGLFSSDDRLADALLDAGTRSGDRCWRMPLWPEYRKQIETADADLKNVGGTGAGAVTAAVFLKEFVDEAVPWAHLDIAGVANLDHDEPCCPKGATGFGVRLLVEYLRSARMA